MLCATLHLRLLDGRPFFSVMVGACQFGTAWAGLFTTKKGIRSFRSQEGDL